MRKRFVFTAMAILLVAGSAVQAQVLSYGAKLGMGFPGFIDERIASQRITLDLGLTGSVKFTDGIQLMMDLGYQRKGSSFRNKYLDANKKEVPDSSYRVKTNLDYIDIPLYLRLSLGHSSKFYVQFGGYYGYLVHANFTGQRLGEMVKRVPIKDGLQLHDYGVIAGGGIETPIRQGLGIILDIKYQYGLRDLNKNNLIIGNSNPIKNKGLALTMGFYVDVD
ncbi:MAG: porin family protein [Bacteroidales bacterium]|nr:porin family protein [Bacteroidales bacterium]